MFFFGLILLESVRYPFWRTSLLPSLHFESIPCFQKENAAADGFLIQETWQVPGQAAVRVLGAGGPDPTRKGAEMCRIRSKSRWLWLKVKQEGIRRFWFMFPIGRVPFWVLVL